MGRWGVPAAGGWVVLVVGAVALAARLGPVLVAGTLRGVQGYDDGVHLAVAQRLIAGVVLYRDEVFLHPPGIAVALAPFAALAGPLGDSWALGLARLAFMVLGTVNAMLIARILLPRGALAAAVGGGAYALWGAAVSAEHTVFLETPINLGLLIALGLLARTGTGSARGSRAGSRAVMVSGLALGVAVTFKIWVVIDAVALGALVLARWGPRTLVRWFGWCVLGAAPVLVPFLVLAPGEFWQDVVVVQGARPVQDKGLADRLGAVGLAAALHIGSSILVAVLIGAVVLAAVLGPLVVAVVRRTGPAAWPDLVWWGVLAALQLAALAVAPSFYSHYGAFVVPALSLLLGAGAGRLASAVRARGGRAARAGVAGVVAVVVAAGLGLALARPPLPVPGRVDNAVLADFAARHDCLWVRNPSYLQLADATARQIRAHCPASMDLVGVSLVLADRGRVPGSAASDIDALVLEQLTGSDGALLVAGHPTQGFGKRARAYLAAHFAPVGRTGEIQMWTRTS